MGKTRLAAMEALHALAKRKKPEPLPNGFPGLVARVNPLQATHQAAVSNDASSRGG